MEKKTQEKELQDNFDVFKSRGFKWQASKKHGGKITYKMTGGQVVDAGYE